MNILLNYLIIGIGRRLFMQIIISKTEDLKRSYDVIDTITSGKVNSNNQNIAEFSVYSWKAILFHIVAWPICVMVDIIGIIYCLLYCLFKKD